MSKDFISKIFSKISIGFLLSGSVGILTSYGVLVWVLQNAADRIEASKAAIQVREYRLDCVRTIVVDNGNFKEVVEIPESSSVLVKFVKDVSYGKVRDSIIVKGLKPCPK